MLRELLNEGAGETVYAIKRGDDGYVDKGGRKTNSITQMWLWKTSAAAEKILLNQRGSLLIPDGMKMKDVAKTWKVVPVKVNIG